MDVASAPSVAENLSRANVCAPASKKPNKLKQRPQCAGRRLGSQARHSPRKSADGHTASNAPEHSRRKSPDGHTASNASEQSRRKDKRCTLEVEEYARLKKLQNQLASLSTASSGFGGSSSSRPSTANRRKTDAVSSRPLQNRLASQIKDITVSNQAAPSKSRRGSWKFIVLQPQFGEVIQVDAEDQLGGSAWKRNVSAPAAPSDCLHGRVSPPDLFAPGDQLYRIVSAEGLRLSEEDCRPAFSAFALPRWQQPDVNLAKKPGPQLPAMSMDCGVSTEGSDGRLGTKTPQALGQVFTPTLGNYTSSRSGRWEKPLEFVHQFFKRRENLQGNNQRDRGVEVVDEFHGRPVTREERERWVSVFRRLWNDGEIHRTELENALLLCGYEEPDKIAICESAAGITRFATLSEPEFVSFCCLYDSTVQHMYAKVFSQYGNDDSAPISMLQLMFDMLGMTVRRCVLDEIANDLDKDKTGRIQLEQFGKVVQTARSRDAFLQRELAQFHSVFNRFVRRESQGEMGTQDLGNAFEWLGFPVTPVELYDLLQKEDVDGSGTFSEKEFVRCLRRVQNTEDSKIKSFLNPFQRTVSRERSTNGVTKGLELTGMLQRLGYFAQPEAILDATAADKLPVDNPWASRHTLENVSFQFDQEHLSQLLSTLRSQELFPNAEMEELKRVFATFKDPLHDYVKPGDISKALRWFWSSLPWDVTQQQIACVDVDGSACGCLNFMMFLKIVRLCHNRDRHNAEAAFRNHAAERRGHLEGESLLEALKEMGCVDRNGEHLPLTTKEKFGVDTFAFYAMFERLRCEALGTLRNNSGFNDIQLAKLEADFMRFQKDDHEKGLERQGIRKSELVLLLESLVPSYAYSAGQRPHLTGLLRDFNLQPRDAMQTCKEYLPFREFVQLMRLIYDEDELQKLQAERQVFDKMRFSHQEVKKFRETFLAADTEGIGKLSFQQVKDIFLSVKILGLKTDERLKRFFDESISDGDTVKNHAAGNSEHVGDCAMFRHFLRLMRKIGNDRKDQGLTGDFMQPVAFNCQAHKA